MLKVHIAYKKTEIWIASMGLLLFWVGSYTVLFKVFGFSWTALFYSDWAWFMILSAPLFVCMFVFSCVKLLGRRPGLSIDENGISDYTSLVSWHTSWMDIIDIERNSVGHLRVYVINPGDHVAGMNPFRKYLFGSRRKQYDTPLVIFPHMLKFPPDQLEALLKERLTMHR